MSVNIGWVPYKPKKMKCIDGTSTDLSYLEKAFGTTPVELTTKDIPILSGMGACGFGGADDLIQAITDFETITLMAEW